MKCLDLRLGNPEYLIPYWESHASRRASAHVTIAPDEGIRYEKDSGNPKLKREILRIHSLVGNVSPDGCMLIIGGGATQLIVAALMSLEGSKATIEAPHYFMFPDLIAAAGKVRDDDDPEIAIVVDPTNPTNKRASPLITARQIHDLSYNWPQYGKVFQAECDIMIFGLAKATGHCASRIGWAFVRDQDLARKMVWEIELMTGGVSYEGQIRASKILSDQSDAIEAQEASLFDYAKKELEWRWETLKSKNKSPLLVKNDSGMFAWCQYLQGLDGGAEAFLRDYNILTVPGPRCDGPADHLRINMGCSKETFDEMIRRISK